MPLRNYSPTPYTVAEWYGAGLATARYRSWVRIPPTAAVYQRQLSVPSLRGRLMSTSESWGVNKSLRLTFFGPPCIRKRIGRFALGMSSPYFLAPFSPPPHILPVIIHNEYQRKLGSKRAYHAMHWPRIRGLAAAAGVRLRAMERRSAPPNGPSMLGERTLLFYTRGYGSANNADFYHCVQIVRSKE